MNPPFRFKQFAIHQDRCAMKVGTDGILLGAWADAEHPTRILDIGTGTGVVALMLAQRFPHVSIDAVEIEPSACQQAVENFANSPWGSRIRAVCADVTDWSQLPTHGGRYALIVSNPPWFEDSLKPPTQARSIARHTSSLSHNELIAAAGKLLSPGGSFCVILPAMHCDTFTRLANQSKMHCCRCCDVLPNAGKPARRILLQFCSAALNEMCEHSELIVETDIRHQYTADFMGLTQEFYLRF